MDPRGRPTARHAGGDGMTATPSFWATSKPVKAGPNGVKDASGALERVFTQFNGLREKPSTVVVPASTVGDSCLNHHRRQLPHGDNVKSPSREARALRTRAPAASGVSVGGESTNRDVRRALSEGRRLAQSRAERSTARRRPDSAPNRKQATTGATAGGVIPSRRTSSSTTSAQDKAKFTGVSVHGYGGSKDASQRHHVVREATDFHAMIRGRQTNAGTSVVETPVRPPSVAVTGRPPSSQNLRSLNGTPVIGRVSAPGVGSVEEVRRARLTQEVFTGQTRNTSVVQHAQTPPTATKTVPSAASDAEWDASKTHRWERSNGGAGGAAADSPLREKSARGAEGRGAGAEVDSPIGGGSGRIGDVVGQRAPQYQSIYARFKPTYVAGAVPSQSSASTATRRVSSAGGNSTAVGSGMGKHSERVIEMRAGASGGGGAEAGAPSDSRVRVQSARGLARPVSSGHAPRISAGASESEAAVGTAAANPPGRNIIGPKVGRVSKSKGPKSKAAPVEESLSAAFRRLPTPPDPAYMRDVADYEGAEDEQLLRPTLTHRPATGAGGERHLSGAAAVGWESFVVGDDAAFNDWETKGWETKADDEEEREDDTKGRGYVRYIPPPVPIPKWEPPQRREKKAEDGDFGMDENGTGAAKIGEDENDGEDSISGVDVNGSRAKVDSSQPRVTKTRVKLSVERE